MLIEIRHGQRRHCFPSEVIERVTLIPPGSWIHRLFFFGGPSAADPAVELTTVTGRVYRYPCDSLDAAEILYAHITTQWQHGPREAY
jgi:hypothetical protein